MKGFVSKLVLLVGISFAAALVFSLIWAGSLKYTAPVLCPETQSDPFVVRHEGTTSSGSRTVDVSLYCVGELGKYTEVGYLKPMLIITPFFLGALLIVALVLRFLVRKKKRGGSGPIENPAPQGPIIS